ncbi:MAG: tRNA (adenine-N1)-methyltransferase [Synergistaceae bacterium]
MIKAGDVVNIWNPKKGDSYLLKVIPGQSFGTHFAQIKHDELIGRDFGEASYTAKGDLYYILRPTIANFTRRIKRQTQIIFPKDAGFILLNLNIAPGCRIVECGTGSGSLTCTLANFVGDNGKVYTYDRRAEFSAIAQKNAQKWGVDHRVEFNIRDLEEGFKETDADAVFLDVPTPWDFIDKAYDALAFGSRLGILVPTMNQLSATIQKLEEFNFVGIEVVEIMMRHFKTDYKRLRPTDMMIGHTGYLIFGVKTYPLPEPPQIEETTLPEKPETEE